MPLLLRTNFHSRCSSQHDSQRPSPRPATVPPPSDRSYTLATVPYSRPAKRKEETNFTEQPPEQQNMYKLCLKNCDACIPQRCLVECDWTASFHCQRSVSPHAPPPRRFPTRTHPANRRMALHVLFCPFGESRTVFHRAVACNGARGTVACRTDTRRTVCSPKPEFPTA